MVYLKEKVFALGLYAVSVLDVKTRRSLTPSSTLAVEALTFSPRSPTIIRIKVADDSSVVN